MSATILRLWEWWESQFFFENKVIPIWVQRFGFRSNYLVGVAGKVEVGKFLFLIHAIIRSKVWPFRGCEITGNHKN